MESMIDIFSNNAFGVVELSQAINLVPIRFGRLNELNVFPERGVTTTTIAIEYNNNELTLLPFRQRGEPASQGLTGKRNVRMYSIPHIPHEDVVRAADIQNVRAFGTGGQLAGVMDVMNMKLLTMANKHDITLEHLRACMTRGLQVDADGTTLLNLFTDFGVAEIVQAFDLGNANTDIVASSSNVKRAMEDQLMGDTMSEIRALCSPEFWDAFISHPKVVDAYKFFQANQGINPVVQDLRKGFRFQDITWEEYRGYANYRNADGTYTQRRFIPAGDCRFVPLGTQQTFGTHFAPGTFLEAVNTPGLKRYAKQAPEKHNRWIDIYTESNPFPFCAKPRCLIRGHKNA